MSVSFGIIISCYRQWQYIDDAIQSVLDQTYKKWHLYIINDEGTPRPISGEYSKISRFYDGQHKGLAKRLNEGLDLCKEDYVLFLGADDMLGSHYLENAARNIEQSGVSWLYADCRVVSNDNVYRHHKSGEFSRKRLKKGNFIPCCSVVCDTKELRRIRFNERLKAFEDWEMWLVLSKFYQPNYLPQIAYTRRDHTSVMRNDIWAKNKWMSLKRRIKRIMIKRKFRIL